MAPVAQTDFSIRALLSDRSALEEQPPPASPPVVLPILEPACASKSQPPSPTLTGGPARWAPFPFAPLSPPSSVAPRSPESTGSSKSPLMNQSFSFAPISPPSSVGSPTPGDSSETDAQLQTGKGKSVQDKHDRPIYTFSSMIVKAIRSHPDQCMQLRDILEYIEKNYKYFKKDAAGWRDSVRHNLSLNTAFVRLSRPLGEPGRGDYWALAPDADDVTVGETTGRLRYTSKRKAWDRPSRAVRTKAKRDPYGHPYFESLVGGVPYNEQDPTHSAHLFAQQFEPHAVYFPTPEEICAMRHAMWKSHQERQIWAMYQQHLQHMREQQYLQFKQQQLQQAQLLQQQHLIFQQQLQQNLPQQHQQQQLPLPCVIPQQQLLALGARPM